MPEGVGRGVSLQFVFGTYMAQVAEVEVAKDGAVRVRRVVCAVDCGTVVNPDTVQAQIQSAIIFGITAALYGEITLKDGRVEQANFDTYQMLRMNEAPAIEVHIVQSSEPPGGMGEAGTSAIVPAVTNAIFAATGKRLRKLPVDTAALKHGANPTVAGQQPGPGGCAGGPTRFIVCGDHEGVNGERRSSWLKLLERNLPQSFSFMEALWTAPAGRMCTRS